MKKLNEKNLKGKIGQNYVESVVMSGNCTFHPTLQEIDIGIDGQIELFTYEKKPLGKFVFVQVKTGSSYYNLNTMNFHFPMDGHLEYWKSLKSPVIGIVCVMNNDTNIVSNAYWVDIKRFIDDNYSDILNKKISTISFYGRKDNEFNVEAFRKYFFQSQIHKLPNISFTEAKELISLSMWEKSIGIIVLCTKYSKYVETWEILFEEYEKNDETLDLYYFFSAISYAFPHPDNMLGGGYYELSREAKDYIHKMVNDFSIEDIITMVALIGDEGIDRGTIGQTITVLLEYVDNAKTNLLSIMRDKSKDYDLLSYAEHLLAYLDPDFYLEVIDTIEVMDRNFTDELIQYISENGGISFY